MKNNLIIKLNENPLPNPCPLCGEQTNPNIGAELFLVETDTIVCLDCASEHAPVLAVLISFNDFSRLFHESGESIGRRMETYFGLSKMLIEAENEFGAKWTDAQGIKERSINSYQSFGVQKAEVQSGL